MNAEKSFKKRMIENRARRQLLNRYLGKEFPHLTHTIWHVDKFVPAQCPNCNYRFKSDEDHTYLAIDRSGRSHLMSKIEATLVCGKCDRCTTTMSIESRNVRTHREARSLIRDHGFTIAFPRLVSKKDFDDCLAHPSELHPLGIGLAIMTAVKDNKELTTNTPGIFFDQAAQKKFAHALRRINTRKLAADYASDLRAFFEISKTKNRKPKTAAPKRVRRTPKKDEDSDGYSPVVA